MKKISVIVLLMITVLVLVACGRGDNSSESQNQPTMQDEVDAATPITAPEPESGSNPESNTPADDPNNQGAANSINEPITQDISEDEAKVREKLAGGWHFGEGGFGFTFYSDGTAEMHFGATGTSEHPHPGSLNGTYTVHLTSDDLYRIDFEISGDKSIHEQIYGQLPLTQPFTYNYITDELTFLGADDLDRPMLRI